MKLLALMNTQIFEALVALQLGAADAAARSYEVGLIQKVPVPDLVGTARWRDRHNLGPDPDEAASPRR